MPEYKDFKIIISPNGADEYLVRVEKTEKTGEAAGFFKKTDLISFITAQNQLNADADKLKRKMKILSGSSGGAGGGGGGGAAVDYNEVLSDAAADAFGKNLSDIVFSGAISTRLSVFKVYCDDNKAFLRIRLDLSLVPELAALPWEYLRYPEGGDFVCLDEKATLVRYLQTAFPTRPLKVDSSLRLLVATSLPKGEAFLDVSSEIEKIKTALTALNNAVNKIRVEVLSKATAESLRDFLDKAQKGDDPFHILHFIGHGEFDETKKQGELLFEDDAGNPAPCPDDDFAHLLKPFNPDLRLVVLNSCQGATLSNTDSYSSVATKIMQSAEIPAVIAMQFSITDKAAVDFSQVFYAQLASGAYLEEGVYQARDKIKITSSNEWATPVLYLRSDDGRLFDIKIPKVNTDQRAHYSALKELLQLCRYVIFLGLDVNTLNRPVRDPWETKYGFPSTAELYSYFNNQLDPNPQSKSLAGLATQLEIDNRILTDEFVKIFRRQTQFSKLYETLAQITEIITRKLPSSDEAKDKSHSGLLFVTATFDSNLEAAFQQFGVKNYHVIFYDEDDYNNPIFSRKSFEEGKPEPPKIFITQEAAQSSIGLDNKYPVILKLQGQSEYGSSLIVSEDNFIAFTGKERSKLIPQVLTSQITSSRHLYLGYNIQDWSLRMLWSWLCLGQNIRERNNSSAVIGTNDSNAAFWEKYDVHCIAIDFDDYVEGLEKLVLKELQNENENG